MKTNLLERFLSYVVVDTQSDPSSESVPSTKSQFDLAKIVEKELLEMGLKEVTLDEKCYLTAMLPTNSDKNRPPIGFVAHFDTSSDCSGKDVKPQLVKNYQGQIINLGESQYKLDPEEYPILKELMGHDLVTTDGTTLLGADNKAGIAEIVTAIKYLVDNPQIEHGDIFIGFTPDEEIGRGADHFPLKRFKASWAYTIDGGPQGELEYENFNAAQATIEFTGISIHPGSAKGLMINSQTLAAQFHAAMPADETPETTEGYEGFFHLVEMNGTVEETKLTYIIRDFDDEGFQNRKLYLEEQVRLMNEKLGQDMVKLVIKDSYKNMYAMVSQHPHVIEIAKKAMEEVGVKPLITPIRGGTDGARLSYMGLPCPNIFTGGCNFHGRHEFISVDAMVKAVETIVKIAESI
jgi:tripeptide aminopeptidase